MQNNDHIPAHTATPTAPNSTPALPIAAILLPSLAALDLWIAGVVPGYQWFDSTLPRVLLIFMTIVYLLLIWVGGVATTPAVLVRLRLWRSTIALGLIVLIVLVPMAMFMRDRLARGPYPGNVIDWPLQIEAGTDLLLHGRSPYAFDYSATEMKLWSERANFPNNPALRHAIHLPFNFVLGALTMPPWRALTGWYDARVILIGAYLLVLLVAPRLTRDWEAGHALQIGLAFNPLLVDTFVVGLSDYLLIAIVVMVLWLRQRGRLRSAAALLGLAVATRQFSWLLVPIYLAAEWYALPHMTLRARVQALLRCAWPLPLLACVVIAPFFVANPRGFYADVIAFGSGGIADAFPIGGPASFGFSAVVLGLGWVRDQSAQFPFTLIQLGVTLPLTAFAIWTQRRQNSLRRMLLSYVVVLAAFLFTGRFMNSNYVGFLFALLLLAYFVDETPLGAARVVVGNMPLQSSTFSAPTAFLDKESAPDYTAELRDFHQQAIQPYLGVPKGCPAQMIVQFEQAIAFELPLAYHQYLAWMGQDYHGVFQGTNCFITNVKANIEALPNLLAKNNVGFTLPKSYLVFYMHQGYAAAWFQLPKESDNPTVWFYSEGEGMKQPLVAGTFTEFILADMKALSAVIAQTKPLPQ